MWVEDGIWYQTLSLHTFRKYCCRRYNFIDANSTVIDSERLAVYGWNGSDYDIYNLLTGAFSIAPGQGFWVAAAGTSDAALNFTAAMRTTTGTGDFVQDHSFLLTM